MKKFSEIVQYVESGIENGPVAITWGMLPAQRACEDLADMLSKSYLVRVNRSGTGNGNHTGYLGGCAVNSIECLRRVGA